MARIEIEPVRRPLATRAYVERTPAGHIIIDYTFDNGRCEHVVSGVTIAAGDFVQLAVDVHRQLRALGIMADGETPLPPLPPLRH